MINSLIKFTVKAKQVFLSVSKKRHSFIPGLPSFILGRRYSLLIFVFFHLLIRKAVITEGIY